MHRTALRYAFDRLFGALIASGSLAIRYPDGITSVHRGGPGPAVGLAFADWGVVRRMLLNPGLALGEGYMEGRITPLDCTLHELLDVMVTNLVEGKRQPVLELRSRLAVAARRWAQFNPADRARRNVAHHYDIGIDFYRLILDDDLQYSCAYFPRGDESLDEAQAAKKGLIARKLLLRPGLRVLDIGCGWGGLALTLARDHGVEVTGITLSEDQLAVARRRAAEAGLADRVRFELQDYRAVTGTWDRVVSVGMFEHVGINHYRAFFAAVRRALAPDGVALVHAIGRAHGPEATNPWLAKYIFPGGYSPALSEVLPAAERSGLFATDVEILRLHYAETLRRWRDNLDARRTEVVAMFDERFLRMFRFYFSGAELAFRRSGHMVWHLQLAHRADAVPLTRDYLWQGSRIRAAERALSP